MFQFGQTLMCKKQIEGTSITELTRTKMKLSLNPESASNLRYLILVPSAVDSIKTEIEISVDGSKVFTKSITSTEIQAISVQNEWFTETTELDIEILESSETWQVSILVVFSETEIEAPDFKDISTLYQIAAELFSKNLGIELERIVSQSSQIDSECAEKYLIEAFLYEVQKAYRKVFDCYQKAFEADPEHNIARRLYGFWLARNSDFDKAKTILSPLLKKTIEDFETLLAWQHYLVILIAESSLSEIVELLQGIDQRTGPYAFHFLYVWKMLLEFVTSGKTELRPENDNQRMLLREIAMDSGSFAVGARNVANIELTEAFTGLGVICCKIGGSYVQDEFMRSYGYLALR